MDSGWIPLLSPHFNSEKVRFLAFLGGFFWGVTVVVSAVKSQGHWGFCRAFSATLLSQLVLTSGGFRVELSQIARRPLARVVVVGWWLDRGCLRLLSTVAGMANFFNITYVLCFTEETASMVYLDWRVARVGVRPCLCGQGLRSRSSWSGSEVSARRVHGESLGLVFGSLFTGTGPWGSCLQGHGPQHSCIHSVSFPLLRRPSFVIIPL